MANASTSRIAQRKSLRNATFEHKKTFPAARGQGYVEACTIMPSGHLIIAYYDRVVLMDINFKFMSQEDLSDVSGGIATVNDAIVIVPRDNKYLQYIHVNLSVSHPFFTLGNRIDVIENVICKAIDVSDNHIYVLCLKSAHGLSEIRVLNKLSGVIHKIIILDAFKDVMIGFQDMKVSPNGDRVYVSANMSVICISTRGDLVYKYSSRYTMTDEMYVDNEDNLLVSSYLTNNIYFIDKDGREMKVVLKESDSILFPRWLFYRELDSWLVLVSNYKILTFKVKW